MSFAIEPSLLGLEGAVALVTGAGHGIARGCALQLAAAGCHVAVVDLDEELAQATCSEIEQLGRGAIPIAVDVLGEDGTHEMVRRTVAHFGSIDIACNVVGSIGHPPKSILDLSLEEWNVAVHRNLGSTFLSTRAEALAMIEARTPGRIINVASTSGVVGGPNVADYGAANVGVIHFTRSAAMEFARYGLRVNCIVPGTHARSDPVPPNMASPGLARFFRLSEHAPPLGRLGDPYETGGLAVFLASKLSSYTTGHAVFSDGGIVFTTARPPVGMTMMPGAIADLDWVRDLHEQLAADEGV